jgi:hypothetical protein
MNIRDIHFIREILVTDLNGETPTMQFSNDNASYLRPNFLPVPSVDQEQIRGLYMELGGSRSEGAQAGTTVVIPNRSFWAGMRQITPDEVRVVPG